MIMSKELQETLFLLNPQSFYLYVTTLTPFFCIVFFYNKRQKTKPAKESSNTQSRVLKTMLEISIFCFSHNAFYTIEHKTHHLSYNKSSANAFILDQSLNSSFGTEVTLCSMCTNFNALMKKALGAHCGKM